MPDEAAFRSGDFDIVFFVDGCDEIRRVAFRDLGEHRGDREFGLQNGIFFGA